MIIKSLVDLYDEMAEKGAVPKENWAYWDVSGILDLDEEGNLLSLIPVAESDKGKLIKKSMLVPQAFLKRTSGILPNFLCDNLSYFLGIDYKKDSLKATVKKFEAAKKLHRQVLDGVSSKVAEAILKYFDTFQIDVNHPNELVTEHLKMIATGNLVFRVNGEYAQDDVLIQTAWQKFMNQTLDTEIRRCIITGKKDHIPEIHLGIKLPGAKPGAALISFNDESYTSYGLDRNGNSAVGEEAAFKYVTALNYLLTHRDSHTGIGDVQLIYWSKSGKPDYQKLFGTFLIKSEESDKIIHNVFEKLSQGQMIDTNISANEPFFILGLTPNAARISARFFMENSFGSILSNLQKHNERMKMIKPTSINFDFIHFYHLVQQTVDKKSKDKLPKSALVGDLVVSVLNNTPYPETIFSSVMQRIQAERGNVTWERASIIKAFLLKNRRYNEENLMAALNEKSSSVPYNLGRLFSVLEKLQRDCTEAELNTTIKEQYFSSASASPLQVFPNLIVSSGNHLRKLRSNKFGIAVNADKLIGNIIGSLNEWFPETLSLDQQGEFALGYYQQKFFKMKNEDVAKDEEVKSPSTFLNEYSSNEAYNLGRLFSILEKLQQDSESVYLNMKNTEERSETINSNGQVGTTIKDRYFGSASVAPSRVFPELIKLSSNHLRKLRIKNPAVYVNYDKRIGEIINLLNGNFPKTLDLKQKGSFVIGYYQQRQKLFEKKNENEPKKEWPARLDESKMSKPYNLGRLFSVLELVQQDSADEELNTTIKDRYFSSAAAAPGKVYSQLLILSKYHLRKLQRKNFGTYVYFKELIKWLTDRLDGFYPKMMNTDEQGEFIIGYYQQRKKFFEKKRDLEIEGGTEE